MRADRRTLAFSLCAISLAACAVDGVDEEMEVVEQPAAEMPAPAEAPLTEWAGTWEAVAVMESGDTVPYTFTASEDRTGWTATLPDRDPMPLRVLSVEGDSVVTELGPYESLLREGVQVTVRQVGRIQNGRMEATMEAHYSGGDEDTVVAGTVEGTRTD